MEKTYEIMIRTQTCVEIIIEECVEGNLDDSRMIEFATIWGL